MLQKYKTKSPSNAENDITSPFPFNLMFRTTIGPEGTSVGFLRPETAQGLFVNFRRLLDYNSQRMPFAAAQIGLAFRNEISPRNGLLRVREFCMAEIEHFVNPNDKKHPKFKNVHNKELTLFTADNQLGSGRTIKMTIKEAVDTKIVDNETLAYFMTRTQLYLEKIGVDPTRMRFRQHLKTEMAHYATDCWDMEIQMSYGWIECVGHADRACYDLEVHSKKTNVSMCASQLLNESILVNKMVAEPNKRLLGPRFKLEQKLVIKALESLEEEAILKLQQDFESKGESLVEGFTITKDLVTFKNIKKTVSEVKYMPSVIEPSFGMGRVLYAVLEHSFSQRNGDENRCVMAFKPCVAPIKVGIFKLVNNPVFDNIVNDLHNDFQENNICNKIDSSSGTVGRKYARADELGIPFGITVDFDSLTDNCVTVRDRDTMSQVRVSISHINSLIMNLVSEKITWAFVMTRYMVVNEGGDEDDEKKKIEANPKNTFIEFTTRGNFTRPNFPK
jgi:glycyl-tRNA synthetase